MTKTSCTWTVGAPAILAMAMAMASAAWAQADPTKPSAEWMAANGGPALQAEAGVGDAQIILSGASRRFVIVNGTVVRQGEMHNGAKLLSVVDGSATWQKGAVREVPSMSPAVEKTPVVMAQGRTTNKKHNKQANGEVR